MHTNLRKIIQEFDGKNCRVVWASIIIKIIDNYADSVISFQNY